MTAASIDPHKEKYTAPRNLTHLTTKLAHLLSITYWIIKLRLWFSLPDIYWSLTSAHIHCSKHLTRNGIELWPIPLDFSTAPYSPYHLTIVHQSVRMHWLNVERGVPWLHHPHNYHSQSPSDGRTSPWSVKCALWSSRHSIMWYLIDVVMFGRLIKPCRTLICATPESWWRSLTLLS